MMGERLVIAANEIRGHRRTRFAAVRFGNVIGSRGSVVPIFASQLLRGEPVSITDDQMTRYVMTINEAAELVLEAGHRMLGGEVFVAKMRALAITDLALAMADVIEKPAVDVVRTGLRPGEKLYEELISEEERSRSVDLERLLVVIPTAENAKTTPELLAHYRGAPRVTKDWNSGDDTLLTRPEIVAYLREHRVLDPYLRPGGVIPDRDSVPGQ